ncbi:MAG: hypothetical protein WCF12_00645 [Propionicimonas sp.]
MVVGVQMGGPVVDMGEYGWDAEHEREFLTHDEHGWFPAGSSSSRVTSRRW